jgi:hypothetical protein
VSPADPRRFALADAIERLESMPAFLDAALEAAGVEALAERPGPDEFSLAEHACHLRDLEREGYLVRVRRLLSEERPVLAPFDGAAVARSRNYLTQDARLAAAEFAAARRETTGLLAPLTPDDLAREASFEGKRVSFADVIAMMLEHDVAHRDEIERLIEHLED